MVKELVKDLQVRHRRPDRSQLRRSYRQVFPTFPNGALGSVVLGGLGQAACSLDDVIGIERLRTAAVDGLLHAGHGMVAE